MNAVRQHIRFHTFVTLAACLLIAGFMFTETTTAAPVKAGGSISARVLAQTDLCESVGGGQIGVSYSYENGKMVSAQTSCKGGTEGGRVCVNDAKTTDCYKVKEAGTTRPSMQVDDLPLITVAATGEVIVAATSEGGGVTIGADGPETTTAAQSANTMVELDEVDPGASGSSGAPVVELTPVSNPNAGMAQHQLATATPTSVP